MMSDYNTTKHASRCTYLQDGYYTHCDCGVRDRGIELFAQGMGVSVEEAEVLLTTIDSVMGRLGGTSNKSTSTGIKEGK